MPLPLDPIDYLLGRGNIRIPRRLLTVTHGRKFKAATKHWILATRSGEVIAQFQTARALNVWWKAFQRSQGRTPKPLIVGPAPPHHPKNRRKVKEIRKTSTVTGSDYLKPLKPWNDEYQMPEYDLD